LNWQTKTNSHKHSPLCNERKDCENEIAFFAELVKSYNAQSIKARVKNEWNIPKLMADVKEF